MLNVASHFIFIYNFKKCDCNIQIVPYSLNLPPICNLSLKGGLEKSKELNLDVRNNFVKPPTELCRKCSKLSRSMVFNTFFFCIETPLFANLN